MPENALPETSHAIRLMATDDYDALARAVNLLEEPSLAARLANLIGVPIESLLKQLPPQAGGVINKASEVALRNALRVALATMRNGQVPANRGSHKVFAFASGAIGGATGLPGLAIELPVTTTIIFRSIAEYARAEGEDLRDPGTAMASLQVFALGGPHKNDDAVESGYFATRVGLAQAVREATVYLAKGAARTEAPLLVKLVTRLASRFGVVVSYKAAAQLAPILGAAGGAGINMLFLDHYQNMAEGHFTVRRLERTYGDDLVRQAYLSILRAERNPDYLSSPSDEQAITVSARPVVPPSRE